VPVLPPAYTSPAPAKKVSSLGAVPSISAIISNESNVDLALLDQRLAIYSYISGFLPGKDDKRVKEILQETLLSTDFPNVIRWKRNIDSFSEEEIAAWK
jgi:hypothetical protein